MHQTAVPLRSTAAGDPCRWQGAERGLSLLKEMFSESSHGTVHETQYGCGKQMKDWPT